MICFMLYLFHEPCAKYCRIGLAKRSERVTLAVMVKTGVRRSPKEASRDAGKSKDFEVASETIQDATAEAKKRDIFIEANSIARTVA